MTIDDKKCGTCKYFHPWYWNEARGQCHFPVPEWLMLLVKNLSARFDYVPDLGSETIESYGNNCSCWAEKEENK